jgi:hypothetical protein
MSLDVNNNNFPNGRPDLSRFRIDDFNSNRIGNSVGYTRSTDDMVFIPSRRETRGIIPKRSFQPEIPIPIQKESV